MSKPLEKIVKEYPLRGPLKQYRFEKTISFTCFRCSQTKVSKLMTVYADNWNKRLCNGCYGNLLSVYEVKNSTNNIEDKADELANLLLQLVNKDLVRQEESRILLKNNQAKLLTPSSLKFLASSELVASIFGTTDQSISLDWSAAVIGICKAFEVELTSTFVNGLRTTCKDFLIPEVDTRDKDFGRIASYCAGKSTQSPELGVVGHFLNTAVNSKERLETSTFLKYGFKRYLGLRPKSNWLIDKEGLLGKVTSLAQKFRNKAAHTGELTASDYIECKELVFGDNGMMWNLFISTQPRS
jgi:hypothetical protein